MINLMNIMLKILFVCTGNICRSPTAEGVLNTKCIAHGLQNKIIAESAGIMGYHNGAPPDSRSLEAAMQRGYDLSAQQARQFLLTDYDAFDLIIGMTKSHVATLKDNQPPTSSSEIKLLLDFSPAHQNQDVPDPYYEQSQGFEIVLDLIEQACDEIILTVKS